MTSLPNAISGKQAVKYHKTVKIITERCLFSLTERGIVLEEIAPGLDIDRDIIENMEFKPIVPDSLIETPLIAFGRDVMGLRKSSVQ